MRVSLLTILVLLGACRGAPRADHGVAPAPEPVQQQQQAAPAPPATPAYEPNLGPVLDKIVARVPKISYETQVSIGVTWLPTGKRWTVRGDDPQVMASIGKLVWTAAALTRAPIEKIDPLATAAFAISDNEAGASLIDLAGGLDAVNSFVATTFLIPSTAMSFCSYSGGALPRSANNCHHVEGMDAFYTMSSGLTLLEAIWRGAPPLDGERREKLLQWSQLEPNLGFTIRRQLPGDVVVHHKRAEIPAGCCGKPLWWNWTSAIGIIESKKGPYAFAIGLSKGASYPNQPETVEWASCVVYRNVMGEDDSTCRPPGG